MDKLRSIQTTDVTEHYTEMSCYSMKEPETRIAN